jgi:hypothetical protein
VRHLKPPHARTRIGVDTLTITPQDAQGNQYCIVVVEHFTKYSTLYPAKDHSAQTLATALFSHFCRFGVFEHLISDPGSDLMAEVVVQLCKWFGIDKVVSLVDRHESNGVEPTNKKILRHLRALAQDERIVKIWSSPTVLPLVEYFLNTQVHSETGLSPIEAKFGSKDLEYFKLSSSLNVDSATPAYLVHLNDNIRVLREISAAYQKSLVIKRTRDNPATPNEYQPGDFILFEPSSNDPYLKKLSPPLEGPFEVISQRNNDVTCRHLVSQIVEVFHVSRVKLFEGDKATAFEAALRDHDQYVIKEIIAYRGDPLIRTSMEFEVLFATGTLKWRGWDNELFQTAPYEDFCRSRPELRPLLFTVKVAKQEIKRLNSSPIKLVKPGDEVFLDLRNYGAGWYQSLDLPDKDHIRYVVELLYTKWGNKERTQIDGRVEVFNEVWTKPKSLTGSFVQYWGSTFRFDQATMVLITPTMVSQYHLRA